MLPAASSRIADAAPRPPGSTCNLCPACNRFYDPDNPGVGTRAGVVKKATRNAATPLCCSPKAGMVLTEPELADRPAMTSWLEGVLQLQDMANVNQNCILAPALCVKDQLRCQFGRKWKRKFYTLAAPPAQGNQRSGTKWIA